MKSYSQAGQDIFVHDLIGDSGYYIDIGAEDGITHSNTYALEMSGWTGHCVEPNVEAYGRLVRNRGGRATLVAISDHTGEVQFDGFTVGTGTGTPCITLTQLLELTKAPPVVDYLSIDVEGHELEVLAGMDFDRWKVRVATIEHNAYCDGPARKDAIAAIMIGHGFECYADDIVAEGYGEFESWWVSS